jgi:hypothetical protein
MVDVVLGTLTFPIWHSLVHLCRKTLANAPIRPKQVPSYHARDLCIAGIRVIVRLVLAK